MKNAAHSALFSLKGRGLLLFLLGTLGCSGPTGQWQAAHPAGPFESQRGLSPAACGPVALVNALQSSSPRWQSALQLDGDHSEFSHRARRVIEQYGRKPSVYFPAKPRWSAQSGSSLVDLAQMAQDLCAPHALPSLKYALYAASPGAENAEFVLLQRQLRTSLRRGFSPLISLTRMAQQPGSQKAPRWTERGGHLVTVLSLNITSPREVSLTYLDPLNGKRSHASLFAPGTKGGFAPSHAIIAEAPECRIFLNKGRPGQRTVLIVPSAFGAF